MTRPRRGSRRGEDGYVAVLFALLFSTVMLALAAVGVDTARWMVEAERVQTAADSAALAGVVFLPDNLPRATAAAIANARLNGYDNGVNATVRVSVDARRPSELHVEITTEVKNQFGAALGFDRTTVGRKATSDYTSPAPMGSPCNTFGNEPLGGSDLNSGPRETQSLCNSVPSLWAAIEGSNMDKVSGDRYSTVTCAGTSTYECAGGKNNEGPQTPAGFPEGYFFAVKISQGLVGRPVRLQIFDPIYYAVATRCTDNLPNITSSTSNGLNKYTTDAKSRYLAGTGVDRPFCTGDTRQGNNPTHTSFALREATDAQDPMAGAGVSDCQPVQFRGYANRLGVDPDGTGANRPLTAADGTTRLLTGSNNSGTAANRYNDSFAKTFRQWVDMCTFTPKRAGNYFIQVRTNVELGGTPEPNTNGHEAVIYRNNPRVLLPTGPRTEGDGANAFSLRAIASPADQVSVSGWGRMPMLQNKPDNEAEFHMLRVVPAAAGQSISFEFFDAADISGTTGSSGTVTVIPPADATGGITKGLPGCMEARNKQPLEPVAGSTCSVSVSDTRNNGQLHKMRIPIPADYSCTQSSQTGCWFKVRVKLNGNITDFTTWDASLEGDPVRLIE